MKSVALFDFDGTITNRDSFYLFLKYCFGIQKLWMGGVALSPVLAAYKMKFYSAGETKQRVVSYYFKGWTKSHFYKYGEEFARDVLPRYIRDVALSRIDWHRSQGHQIFVVSASLEEWLRPWCAMNDVGLISTRLKYVNDVFTGKFLTPNCTGREKVKRIECLGMKSKKIYAYGDSVGDAEMLKYADFPFLHFQPLSI